MSYSELNAETREIAERILTEKQLEAFLLEQRMGLVNAARHLSITKGSLVSRLDGAHLKLRKAGAKMDGSGHWYMEDVA